MQFVQEVRNYGVKIAIDDFGSGYSNFSRIIDLNPDILKIDGSLIKNIDTDKNKQKIVKSKLQKLKEIRDIYPSNVQPLLDDILQNLNNYLQEGKCV